MSRYIHVKTGIIGRREYNLYLFINGVFSGLCIVQDYDLRISIPLFLDTSILAKSNMGRREYQT
jgi:hypothetical protein